MDLIKKQQVEIDTLNKSLNVEKLAVVEDQILAEAIDVVQHCLNFAELGFDEKTGEAQIPVEWLSLPLREKEKRLRLAKAAWMPSSEAPIGVKLAFNTMVGIIKARAQKESGTKVLNIETAMFPSPAPIQYNEGDVLDVDE